MQQVCDTVSQTSVLITCPTPTCLSTVLFHIQYQILSGAEARTIMISFPSLQNIFVSSAHPL